MNQRLQQKAGPLPSFTPVLGGVLQRKSENAGVKGQVDSAAPPIVDEVLRSPGQPLEPDMRAFFEPRFGHDFGNVRVHTDSRAADSARAVNALAYAVGPNIVLQPDHYEPASAEGRKLLAHELTHVLQQTGANGTNGSEEAAEKEANHNAVTSAGNGNLAVEIAAPGTSMQRQPATADPAPAAAAVSPDLEKVVRAANRARKDPSNATTMMINGSEIVYRLIHEFFPDYDSKISGVGYQAGLKDPSVVAEKGSVEIKVGNDFIFGTNEKTLETRALELEKAMYAKLPRQPIPVQTTPGYEVPGLSPEMRAKVEKRIEMRDGQGAINVIVLHGGGSGGRNIDTSLLADNKMEYDPTIQVEDAVHGMPSWDYLKNKAEPAKVRVGPKSFSSVPYLYSVIMHEYQHVLWNTKLENQEIGKKTHENGGQGGGMFTSEVEAYSWELLHAEESGLSKIPEKIAGVWSNLNEEFWKTEPAAQNQMRSKVQQAFTAAKRFVKNTDVTLDPFKKP